MFIYMILIYSYDISRKLLIIEIMGGGGGSLKEQKEG